MFSRRRFLLTLPALAAAPRLAAAQSFLAPFRRKPLPPQPVFVYFGTDTAKGIAKGIYLSRFDPASGLSRRQSWSPKPCVRPSSPSHPTP